MSQIEIRPLHALEAMCPIEELEKAIWGMDDLEVISVHTLHAIAHSGGQVLGAFDGERIVGFTVSLIGAVDTPQRVDQVAAARLRLYSMIAGVLPGYQNQGIGFRLKLAQRDFALEQGIRLVTWTYDPLESRNGAFNVGKLGAICRAYLPDFHGEMSGINAGIPTDRFEVEWWVTSNRVEGRVAQERRPLSLDAFLAGGALLVNEATFNAKGLPAPPPNTVSRPANLILAEIPADFQAIKQQDMALARRWRTHTGYLFPQLFNSGFIVTDFVSEIRAGQRRSFYLLTHEEA